MKLKATQIPLQRPELLYTPGIHSSEEAIISSHFMHRLARDFSLQPFAEQTLHSRALILSDEACDEVFLPALLKASDAFASNRAHAAVRSAGLPATGRLSQEQVVSAIIELLFDPQFRSTRRKSCDRADVVAQVSSRLTQGLPLDMIIVALPHKLSCPLKSYGGGPDLAEVEFLLGLREILVAADHILARQEPIPAPPARFTVVSDGDRFVAITRTPLDEIASYRTGLADWITRLGLDDTIRVLPYTWLLSDRLPSAMKAEKARLRTEATQTYADVMWPIFDASNLPRMLVRAAEADPDPEPGNAQGRFVSLVKSLMFTINYPALQSAPSRAPEVDARIYRMLVSRLFDPQSHIEALAKLGINRSRTQELREAMLRDVWAAAIDYVAEIKSDREMHADPILTCLPGALRWTIHSKPGQFGIRVPYALGKPIVPWAGIGYIRKTTKGRLTVCTMPRLAAEAAGATPVFLQSDDRQPFFYLDPQVPAASIEAVLNIVQTIITRLRKR